MNNLFDVRHQLVPGRAGSLHEDAHSPIPHFDILYEAERNDVFLQVRICYPLQGTQHILRTESVAHLCSLELERPFHPL